MNAKSKRFQITRPTRKGGQIEKSSMRVQPGLQPPEISIQNIRTSQSCTIRCCNMLYQSVKKKKKQQQAVHILVWYVMFTSISQNKQSVTVNGLCVS